MTANPKHLNGQRHVASEINDEWATPKYIIDYLHEMHNASFDIDVCASAANTVCDRYITKAQDGLSVDWPVGCTAWCNPPYSRGQKERWIAKAMNEASKRSVTTYMLLPMDVSTAWFSLLYYKACATFLLFDHRIQFIPPRGDMPKRGNSFCSMVAVIRPLPIPNDLYHRSTYGNYTDAFRYCPNALQWSGSEE